MRVFADAAWVDGHWRRQVVLTSDAYGVLRDVQARAAVPVLAPADVDGSGCVVLPGLVDGCALDPLAAADAPARDAAAAVQQLVATARALGVAATEARLAKRLRLAAAAGITTVGLPHVRHLWAPMRGGVRKGGGAHADAGAGRIKNLAPERLPWTWADVVVRAARTAGLRVALLDTLQAADGAFSLETELSQFERLVRHLLALQMSTVSWGILLPAADALAADAWVSLRLRLAHLPTVVGLSSRSTALAAWLVSAQAAGALDACCAIVAAKDAHLLPAAAATMHASGCGWLAPSQALIAQTARTDWGTASASARFASQALAWRQALLTQVGHRTARRAAAALGLVGGRLQPGTWADFVLLRPPAGAAVPPADAQLAASLQGGAGAAAWTVVQTFVAGRLVYQRPG